MELHEIMELTGSFIFLEKGEITYLGKFKDIA
jgi:hypothetical protein